VRSEVLNIDPIIAPIYFFPRAGSHVNGFRSAAAKDVHPPAGHALRWNMTIVKGVGSQISSELDPGHILFAISKPSPSKDNNGAAGAEYFVVRQTLTSRQESLPSPMTVNAREFFQFLQFAPAQNIWVCDFPRVPGGREPELTNGGINHKRLTCAGPVRTANLFAGGAGVCKRGLTVATADALWPPARGRVRQRGSIPRHSRLFCFFDFAGNGRPAPPPKSHRKAATKFKKVA